MAENPFKKVGRFVTDELLGIDDFGRAVSKAKKGDFAGALKSAGAGAFELGTTVATPFTGGGSLAAKGAVKGAAVGASKVAAKEAAKGAEKAVVKEAPRQWTSSVPHPTSGGRGGGVSTQTRPAKPQAPSRTTPGYPLDPGKRPAPGGYPKPGDRRDFDPMPGYRPGTPAPKPNVPAVPKPEPVRPKAPAKVKPPIGLSPLPKLGKPEPKLERSPELKPEAKTKTEMKPKLGRVPKAAVPAAVATGIGAAMLLPKKKEEKNYKWNPSAIV